MLRRAQLADQARGVPGGAGELLSFQQHHVAPAEFRQVVATEQPITPPPTMTARALPGSSLMDSSSDPDASIGRRRDDEDDLGAFAAGIAPARRRAGEAWKRAPIHSSSSPLMT